MGAVLKSTRQSVLSRWSVVEQPLLWLQVRRRIPDAPLLAPNPKIDTRSSSRALFTVPALGSIPVVPAHREISIIALNLKYPYRPASPTRPQGFPRDPSDLTPYPCGPCAHLLGDRVRPRTPLVASRATRYPSRLNRWVQGFTGLITGKFSLDEPVFLLLHGRATPEAGMPSGVFRFTGSERNALP